MSQPQLVDAGLELQRGVAVLTFQRDDIRNALTGTRLVEDIVTAVEWANRTPEVSAMVLTGSGRAFSAGGNIKEMHNRSGMFAGSVFDIQDQYRRDIQRLPRAMDRAEIPLIAAVNGPAIGAGMDLACMCDLRLGSTQALFGETFINLGIIPGEGGAWFLSRLVGEQKAAELILTGRLVKADEALALGLLLEVTEPEALLPRALELAATIAAKPPQAVRLSKRLLKLARRQELEEYLQTCAIFQGMLHHTEDHQEALSAMLNKKEPRYRGR